MSTALFSTSVLILCLKAKPNQFANSVGVGLCLLSLCVYFECKGKWLDRIQALISYVTLEYLYQAHIQAVNVGSHSPYPTLNPEACPKILFNNS